MWEDYFSIQIFFIIFREVLETAIIISVLLLFINQQPRQDASTAPKLRFQVWAGAIGGLLLCLLIGLVFVLLFHYVETDYWLYAERVWEGGFSLLASVVITVMGLGLLRINKVMKVKWWVKLGDAYNSGADPVQAAADNTPTATSAGATEEGTSRDTSIDEALPQFPNKERKPLSKRYFLALLPFITTLREGLEAVVFIGGIGLSLPTSSIPLLVVLGAAFGAIVGYVLYRGGNKMSLQYFLILSTCFLYIVSAGLMLRGVWFFELEQYVRRCGGLDPSETGSGPGLYDISKSVWHVNCCNGLKDGWWMVANAIFGWTNSATYGSVGIYLTYWIVVIVWLRARLFEERYGYLPGVPIKWQLRRIRKKIKMYERASQNNQPPRASLQSELSVEEREAEAAALLG